MENFTAFLGQFGGIVGTSTIFSPIITNYLKKIPIFEKKSVRALLSPGVGFVLTTGLGLATGMDIGPALGLGLSGIMSGSVGSSLRDSIKNIKKGT